MDNLIYFYTAIGYALLIPGAIMCLLPVKDHLRIPLKKLCLLLFPTLVLYSVLMPLIGKQTSISNQTLFSLTIFLCFPIYCMAVEINNIKLFYLFLSNVALLSFGGLAFYMVDAYIVNNGIISPIYDTAVIAQWCATLLLLCFIFLPFFNRKLTWTLDHFHSKSVWKMVWTVPALIMFCNFAMIPADYKNATVGRIFSLYILIDATLLLLFLLFQQMFYLIAKTLIENNEHEKKTQLLQIQANQYQNLLRYVHETGKLRHDFRHTAHTLLTLAQEEHTEKILDYLKEYSQELDAYHPSLFCKHTTTNAILAYYANIAGSQQIQTNYHVDLPEKLLLSDVDLCSILGNLLENAIGGCMDVAPAQRFINLSVDITDNKELYIICVNSFGGNIRKSGAKYLSTKKGGAGIGLLSITATAEKYAGITHFYHSDTEFNSEVMLNIQ